MLSKIKKNNIRPIIILKKPSELNSEMSIVNKIKAIEIINVSNNLILTELLDDFGKLKISNMTKNANGKFI